MTSLADRIKAFLRPDLPAVITVGPGQRILLVYKRPLTRQEAAEIGHRLTRMYPGTKIGLAVADEVVVMPAEHPMRCNATMPPIAGDHTHHCDQPARPPAHLDGVPEHHCGTCGAMWIERVATADELHPPGHGYSDGDCTDQCAAPSPPEQP